MLFSPAVFVLAMYQFSGSYVDPIIVKASTALLRAISCGHGLDLALAAYRLSSFPLQGRLASSNLQVQCHCHPAKLGGAVA
jgi:hypothetical protein